MESPILNLRAGDLVEVRSEKEILAMLGPDGTYEGIPFMPEMRQFCGKKLGVYKRADKICVEGVYICRLRDTVFLDEVRCDGAAHDGCKRMCLIFWKEAWLKRAAPSDQPEAPIDWMKVPEVRPSNGMSDTTYSCQSTALPKVVEPLPAWDIAQYLRDISSRSFTPLQVCKAIFINLYNKIMRVAGGSEFGAAIGKEGKTPSISLDLQVGELVQVKSKEEILETIDAGGKNRGLWIDYEMIRHAGERFRVLRRVDRIILETTGKMREIKNTVLLENAACEGLCRRACARSTHPMWREAWLKRVNEPAAK